MNNYEKIKNMSIEEMAEYFDRLTGVCVNTFPNIKIENCKKTCEQCFKEYLQQEAE